MRINKADLELKQ